MIVSLGEALIDRIHTPDTSEPRVVVGGSPYNVAIALSRLEIDAGLVCPISLDSYGELLANGLQANGTHRCVTHRVEEPTAIADVFTNEHGHPRYEFHRERTADRAVLHNPPVDALPDNVTALHFGSLVLAQERDWPAWRSAIQHARNQGAFIAFDPNLRPALIDDMALYPTRLKEALALADLIKASDEDLSVLKPDCDPVLEAQKWCEHAQIVVLTQGKAGAQLWTQSGIHVTCRDTASNAIVDTVGAGDTFQAALLAWLYHHNTLGAALTQKTAQTLVNFATLAARLNCEKAGCQPPLLSEVENAS